MRLEQYLTRSDLSINEGIERLNSSGTQILLIVDEGQKLLGTVTDGDIRRGILNGPNVASEATLGEIMQSQPTVAEIDCTDLNECILLPATVRASSFVGYHIVHFFEYTFLIKKMRKSLHVGDRVLYRNEFGKTVVVRVTEVNRDDVTIRLPNGNQRQTVMGRIVRRCPSPKIRGS